MAYFHTIFLVVSRWMDRLERAVLTVLVTGMVGVAAVQIILRNLWHTGWPWVDPLLGMALLWLTMLGALAATGLGRHISIDLVSALLPRRWAQRVGRVTALASAGVCSLLAWAAGRYVGFQQEMDISRLLDVPIWKYYMVVPIVFWLMAFRFTLRSFLPASWVAPAPETESASEVGGAAP
ncbi:MAG: TRAP transporter small permease [Verrucomicrobiota bacterium]|jgi:TRAP-type C4-dicarboxylate transport system permease small subunit|nr:TRAP transporter small permease [Verrucomicrobiota bacterium]